MTDRIRLISALSDVVPALNPGAHKKVLAAADKLVILLLCQTPLSKARAYDETAKRGLADFLQQSSTVKELKDVSKIWDAERSVSGDISSAELARDLVDLLFERRYPYTPTTRTLAEARALDWGAREKIKRDLRQFASAKQLKALKSKWDKHADLANAPAAKIAEHLCALVDETLQPAPPRERQRPSGRRRAGG